MHLSNQRGKQFETAPSSPPRDEGEKEYYPGYYPPGMGAGVSGPRQDWPNYGFQPAANSYTVPQQVPQNSNQFYNSPQRAFNPPSTPAPPEFLSNPFADVAMQYGSKLVGSGKEMVDKEINRFITVAKLRYFFSVDTHYVVDKLKLLIFPYTNKDWSLKYSEKSRLEPRFDHNAPDLYIPFMGYITYVLIAGLIVGTNNLFSPEVLGMMASTALAWTVVEIVIQLITIYFISIPTNLTTLDLLAYSGYKFVSIIICLLLGLMFSKQGYYVSLFYFGASTAFFMVQTLKWRLMSESDESWTEQNVTYSQVAYKRKMYFLLMIGLSHIVQIWWLSSSLFGEAKI